MENIDPRHEIKIVLTDRQLAAAYDWLSLHRAGFRKAYPNRSVHNVYFDTDDLSAYQENLMGIGDRKKLRLRWYGSDRPTTECVLEAKIKRGLLGWKEAESIDASGYDGASDPTTAWAGRLRNTYLAYLIQGRTPSLLNSYDREYHVDSTGNVRVTIDRNLRFGLPTDVAGRNDLSWCGMNVMEIKFSVKDAESARQIIASLPFRRSKFSKYVAGVQLTRGLG